MSQTRLSPPPPLSGLYIGVVYVSGISRVLGFVLFGRPVSAQHLSTVCPCLWQCVHETGCLLPELVELDSFSRADANVLTS